MALERGAVGVLGAGGVGGEVGVGFGFGFGEDVGVEGREGLGGLGVGLWRGVGDEHCVDEGAHLELASFLRLVFLYGRSVGTEVHSGG